ncbi:hypothetical protein [Nannocystis punicea]|uniref:Uncharacterized protein n=1 Tax=Nannocystis punicea TaxID=2995304 RepID=A0ABY7HCZ6_9BACT|nr:hypothetical protein [Nannocystis poenicansa]WAS96955.1 hypothetical protein O0S08_12470 [Nannocystis poenicansa]
MTNFGDRMIRILAITTLVACSPQDAGTVTDDSTGNATDPASTGTGTSTGEPTGTTTDATTTDATPAPTSTTTVETTTGTGPATATDSDSGTDDSLDTFGSESITNDECASTCGVSINCEHPDVDESLGAPPCEDGFHCVNDSACGCGVTNCEENCDPSDPNACSNDEICDDRSGLCVPA